MKFHEAIKQFCAWKKYDSKQITVRNYESHLRHFCLYMKNPQVEEVKWHHIQEYLDTMREMEFEAGSFQFRCIAFRAFFEYCLKMQIPAISPGIIPIPDREYKFPKITTEEDYLRFIKSIPINNDRVDIRNRAMILQYADTGMRLGEEIALRPEQIDTEKMTAMIKTEKTTSLHPIRRIFWTKETNEAIKKWLAVRPNTGKFLYTAFKGQTIGDMLSKSIVTLMFRHYSQEAKLTQPITCHMLRHRFGRKMAEKNANNSTISALMGHASLVSSQVYTIPTSDQMEKQYNQLWGR